MKKTMILTVLLCTLLGIQFTSCIRMSSFKTSHDYNETRNVSPFHSIEITAIGEIFFTQSNDYSFHIEGTKDVVKRHKSIVKDSTLVVTVDNEDDNLSRDGVFIHISAPDLKALTFTGVGTFHCEEPLKLNCTQLYVSGVGQLNIKDLSCKQLLTTFDGIGKCNVHVNCRLLEANINGIGEFSLSGSAKQAKINSNGIGHVDTDGFTIIE